MKSKLFWLALLLVLSNGFTAYKAYNYATDLAETKALQEQLARTVAINKLNDEIAKKRIAELNYQFEQMNLAARENSEQKHVDDKIIAEFEEKVKELENALLKPDDVCLDSDATGRLRQLW